MIAANRHMYMATIPSQIIMIHPSTIAITNCTLSDRHFSVPSNIRTIASSASHRSASALIASTVHIDHGRFRFDLIHRSSCSRPSRIYTFNNFLLVVVFFLPLSPRLPTLSFHFLHAIRHHGPYASVAYRCSIQFCTSHTNTSIHHTVCIYPPNKYTLLHQRPLTQTNKLTRHGVRDPTSAVSREYSLYLRVLVRSH